MAEPKLRIAAKAGTATLPVGDPEAHSTPAQILRDQLATLVKHYRDMQDSGAVEAIHKMRVTTRKLQATLDFLIMKPDELGVKGMKKELREWRRQLSRVRNYDVFLQMIEKRASSKRPVHYKQYQLIADELRKRREQIFVEVRENLAAIDLQGFAAGLGLCINADGSVSIDGLPALHEAKSQGPDGKGPADEASTAGSRCDGPSGKRAAALLGDMSRIAVRAKHRLRQRLGEFEERASEVKPNDDPNDIHQLRIAAKRLRYSMEAVSGLGYGNADRAMAWLKRLQDRLGDLHDIDSFEEEIADIVGRRDFIRDRMQESGGMLHAASRLIGKRHAMAKSILPAKVPPFIAATTRRLVHRLSKASDR